MRGAFYSSQSLKIGNPFVPYGAVMLATGALAIGLAAISLIEIQSALKTLFATDINDDSGPYVLSMLAVGVASGYWVLWGLKSAFVGVRNLGRLVVPPGMPPDFADYDVVRRTFTERTLFSREMPTKGPIAMAYKYVSDKVPFLTPHLQVIVENSISFARRMIGFVVLLGALFFLIDILPEEAIAEAPILAQPFPFLFIGILVVVAGVKIGSLFGLMPPSAPSCNTIEYLHAIRGGGDPVSLPQTVEKALITTEEEAGPNRMSKTGFQTSSGNVNDTGSFEGELFIETQPIPIKHDRAVSVYVLLLFGVLLTLFAVYLFTRVPATNSTGVGELVWPFFQAFVFARIGGRLFRHSHMIMGSFRYESITIYLKAEGTFGRSEIRAGKGITDSFETSNVVVRSDANVKLYGAAAVSESYQLTGQRQIIAMAADADARELLNRVVESLQEFQSEGVVVRGIDVTSKSMDGIAKANLSYESAKRSLSVAEPPPQLESDGTHLISESATPARAEATVSAGPPASSSNHHAETKACPDCAEEVRIEARKCRFCGYRFDEVVSE